MGMKGPSQRVMVLVVVIVTVFVVSVLTALTSPSLIDLFQDDPPPEGGTQYNLTGVRFVADRQLVLSDDGSGFNSTVRNEFNRSELLLVVEIENTSVRWVQRYVYKYYNGLDYIEAEKDNATLMFFEDWEYDTVYTCSIRFVCDTESKAVSSHPLFARERYCSGSFVIRGRRPDRVEFFDVDRLYSEGRDDICVAYYGDPDGYGRISVYDLMIKIRGTGATDLS